MVNVDDAENVLSCVVCGQQTSIKLMDLNEELYEFIVLYHKDLSFNREEYICQDDVTKHRMLSDATKRHEN